MSPMISLQQSVDKSFRALQSVNQPANLHCCKLDCNKSKNKSYISEFGSTHSTDIKHARAQIHRYYLKIYRRICHKIMLRQKLWCHMMILWHVLGWILRQ